MRKRKHIAKALAFVLATGIIATPINNIGNAAVASADESSETVKGDMDKFTIKFTYGAGSDWNWMEQPVEITKDGEYTFTYTTTKDNDKVMQLQFESNLYKGSMNDNFSITADSVKVNDTVYNVDATKATWNNSWSDEKPYTYTLVNGYGNLDSVGLANIKTGDKITVKIKITGMNSKSADAEATQKPEATEEPETTEKPLTNKGNMDKFSATLKYIASEEKDGDTVEITKDGEYTFSYTVQNAADAVNVLYLQTDLYAGSLNSNFKMKAETVTVNETEYNVDTEKTTWVINWTDPKAYQYTLINSWSKIDSVGLANVKAGDKITVKIKVTGTNSKSADAEATQKPEATEEPDTTEKPSEDIGSMYKFKVELTYGAGSDWASYPLEITKGGEYELTHIATADVDYINLLALQTNLYKGSMNSTFKIVSTKVLINDVEYTVSSKATWDNSWDDTKPYSYTLINSWGNLDSLGVKNIKTGDKIVVKFTVGGTNYDVAGEVIMPNAKPTETPTAEPTKEPTVTSTAAPTKEPTVAPVAPSKEPTVAPTQKPTVAPTQKPTAAPTQKPTVAPTTEPTVVPTKKPTVAPTKKPSLKNTTITVKNGKKKVSSVTVKIGKSAKISVSTNSNAKLSISGISKKESNVAKIVLKDNKITVNGLKKGKVKFKLVSKKTSTYKKASKTITVNIK